MLTPEQRHSAMRDYCVPFASHAGAGTGAHEIDEQLKAEIRALREEIRAAEGGGGMCHFVTEVLQNRRGWERMSVTYLSASGEIAVTGHLVSILADGSLVDPTADQLGEGHDIRVLRPNDLDYGRYRPEFDQDFNPGDNPEAAAWADDWTGEADYEAQARLWDERGLIWHVTEPESHRAFLAAQLAYATGDKGSDNFDGWIKARIDELDARLAPCAL